MKFDAIDPMDPLSYGTIKNTLYEWRRSGSKSSNFNELDNPGQLYFKILFHFYNGDAYGNGDGLENGLLTPAWTTTIKKKVINQAGKEEETTTTEVIDINSTKNDINDKVEKFMESQRNFANNNTSLYDLEVFSNCAYTYLLRNDEVERAEKLKQFITLLSNINTYSPWYFTEISGLDGILERPFKVGEDEYKIEAPKQITIKCMPDSSDNRIATLLDLYRDFTFSQINNRVILPGNLRRFDMSIYIFDSPISNLHYNGDNHGIMNKNNKSSAEGNFPVSYKCIELHDCEIDYNATKAGYTSLTNSEGFQQTFEIPISVGNAYEIRYNQYIDRTIGDLIKTDLFQSTYSDGGYIEQMYNDSAQTTSEELLTALQTRINNGSSINQVSDNKIIDDLTGNIISQTLTSQKLGNIYKTSLSDLSSTTDNLQKNLKTKNLGSIVSGVKQLSEVKNGWYVKKIGNSNIYNK